VCVYIYTHTHAIIIYNTILYIIHVENADVIKSIPKFSVGIYYIYTHKTYYASDVIA